MSERILIDAGPMIALFSSEDGGHARYVATMAGLTAPFFTCWPVLTEVAYFLRKRPEATARMMDGFPHGLFKLLHLDADDLPAIAAIMTRYESLGLQLADASLVHLADREGIRTVFTLDRRDLSVVRLQGNRTLRLMPEAAR